ncbi:MAG: tetratricopeptide repeat protein [Saprospiraceae bacterium]
MRLLLFFFLLTATLAAQPGSMTEAEVKSEKAFIEAKREALLGNLDEAIPRFEQIIDEDPANHVAAFELARLYKSREDMNKAVTFAERAYRAQPANNWYRAYLGGLYRDAGRNRDGVDFYEKLVKDFPDDPDYSLDLAEFLIREQRTDDAIKVYDNLQRRIGISMDLSRRKHKLYLQSGDTKRAARELEDLAEARPRDTEALHLLAGFYQSQNDGRRAKETYQRILAIQPADVRAQLALLENAPPPDATSGAGQADRLTTEMGRSDLSIDLKIGKLLPSLTRAVETRDPAVANSLLPAVAELTRVHPDQAKAFSAAGDLYLAADRPADAAAAYRRAIKLDDTVYPLWEQLLAAEYQLFDPAAVSKTAESALDIFPNRPEIYRYYALAQLAAGRTDAAADLLDQGEFMVVDNPPLALGFQLARVRLELAENNMSAARDRLAGLPAAARNTPAARAATAALELNNGRAKEALAQLKPGIDLADPWTVLDLARAQFATGDFAAARQTLAAALPETATHAPALELLGDAQFRAGDTAAALATWQRAADLPGASKLLAKKITDRNYYE